MRRLPAALPVLVLVLAAGACAGRGDLQSMEETLIAEFRELNHRQDSLAAEIRALRRTLLDSLSASEGDALAVRGELRRELESLRQEMGRVAALAGENHRLLAQVRDRVSAGGQAAGGPAGTGTEGDTAVSSGERQGAPEGEGTEATRLYEAALQQFRRGAYGTARSGLEEFLSRFPDHRLAPDARFYVAETYARGGQPDEALEAYGRVVELFPNSRRAASALYKSGQVELERGNVEDARVFFSRVVSGYPDSDEASLAREQLQRLGGGG